MESFDFVDADLMTCPCAGTGWLNRAWLEQRPEQCTCGEGDGLYALHAVSCDSVPCPFCPLEAEVCT